MDFPGSATKAGGKFPSRWKVKADRSWSASSDTALEITMEHPASLYLRGFVGSVYDGSSWTEISTEEAMKKKTCITGFTRRAFMEKPSF